MAAPAIATGYGGRLTVDLGALKRNWQALDKVSRGALTGAVVKADGYGTGIAQASRAFYEAGARFFLPPPPTKASRYVPPCPTTATSSSSTACSPVRRRSMSASG